MLAAEGYGGEADEEGGGRDSVADRVAQRAGSAERVGCTVFTAASSSRVGAREEDEGDEDDDFESCFCASWSVPEEEGGIEDDDRVATFDITEVHCFVEELLS